MALNFQTLKTEACQVTKNVREYLPASKMMAKQEMAMRLMANSF